jgi:stage II sporulation protein D
VGNEVMLYGKGFGHGVGLCQEGAMQMAKKGYTFDQILTYYYPGAILTK